MSSDDECDIDVLVKLLENAEKDEPITEPARASFLEDLANRDKCILENPTLQVSATSKVTSSVLHNGDTDSSDDEEKRNHDIKYNKSGKEIKQLLSDECGSTRESRHRTETTWKTVNQNQLSRPLKNVLAPQSSCVAGPAPNNRTYTELTLGLRIVNPLISSRQAHDKMVGREHIVLSRLKSFLLGSDRDIDWVVSGVLVIKSDPKISQKGNSYSIWTLSDLQGDLKTVAIFLFRGAHKHLWKTSKGTAVAILNPNVLEKRDDSKDEAALSIDNPDRVMILGQSKDLGYCRSKKANGDPCYAFVNASKCEYCVYHVKQEYRKMSTRSELQSSCAGRGLNALRNKVLGKNEVFYAGKSYMAIPAKKSKKVMEKDSKILSSLAGKSVPINRQPNPNVGNKMNAARVETSVNQRLKDIERLKKLGGSSEKIKSDSATSSNSSIGELDKCVGDSAPKISEDLYSSQPICLDDNLSMKKCNIKLLRPSMGLKKQPLCTQLQNTPKKIAAVSDRSEILKNVETKPKSFLTPSEIMSCVKKHVENVDPSTTADVPNVNPKLSKTSPPTDIPVLNKGCTSSVDLDLKKNRQKMNPGRLKALEWVAKHGPIPKEDSSNRLKGTKRKSIDVAESSNAKQQKVEGMTWKSKAFKEMAEAKSANSILVDIHENSERNKYFEKLERVEKMEEKMMGTFKIECKAVRCLKCKYTSFSASDMCKTEGHPLRVSDAFKRFFMCSDCKNRTVTLDVLPLTACKKCGGSRWEKTSMMKSKVVNIGEKLSIRGDEETFIHSVVNGANLNLLIPE